MTDLKKRGEERMGPPPHRKEQCHGRDDGRRARSNEDRSRNDKNKLTSMMLKELFTDLYSLQDNGGVLDRPEDRRHLERITEELPSVMKDLEELRSKVSKVTRSRAPPMKIELPRKAPSFSKNLPLGRSVQGRRTGANRGYEHLGQGSMGAHPGAGRAPAGSERSRRKPAFHFGKFIPLAFAFLIPIVYFYVVLKVMFKITLAELFDVSIDPKTFFVALLVIFGATMIMNSFLRLSVILRSKKKGKKDPEVVPR